MFTNECVYATSSLAVCPNDVDAASDDNGPSLGRRDDADVRTRGFCGLMTGGKAECSMTSGGGLMGDRWGVAVIGTTVEGVLVSLETSSQLVFLLLAASNKVKILTSI